MSIVRYTAEQVAAKGRVRRTKLRRTTEAEIARHAAHDRSSTAHIDFAAALKSGKLRKVDPPYQNRPQKKDSRGAVEPQTKK